MGCNFAELKQQGVQRDKGAERIGERSVNVMEGGIRTAEREGKPGKGRLGSRKDWTVESEDLLAAEIWMKSEDRGDGNERATSESSHCRGVRGGLDLEVSEASGSRAGSVCDTVMGENGHNGAGVKAGAAAGTETR